MVDIRSQYEKIKEEDKKKKTAVSVDIKLLTIMEEYLKENGIKRSRYIEKLIKDGRIQPLKIEQVVAQTKTEMDKILLNEGKKIIQVMIQNAQGCTRKVNNYSCKDTKCMYIGV